MRELEIIFENSPWFILLCVVAGGIYSFLLYQKKSPWSKSLNWSLASLRFILVFFICLLLLGPYLKQLKNYVEEPSIVFAIDNSLSITEGSDSVQVYQVLNHLKSIQDQLKNKGFNSESYTFEGSTKDDLNKIRFGHRSTNLDQMIEDIQSDYEGRKLSGVILLSDGIYNLGASPTYKPYNFNVYSIGIGDTVPKSDVNLRTLYFNKIAYEGNKFPVVAEIMNYGFADEPATVEIYQNDALIEKKTISLEKSNQVQRVEFLVEAKDQGMQHYVVKVDQKAQEFTHSNNQQHAFIDIIEGKQKILMVALAPHPDIKAIRSSLESNQNYEFEVYIPGLTKNDDKVLKAGEQNYDLVIFHQLPDRFNRLANLISHFQKINTPCWFIAGIQTDFTKLHGVDNSVRITGLSSQKDYVTPVVNDNFNGFELDEELPVVLNSFPPVTLPFARWEIAGSSQTILYQKIGNIPTDRPLLLVNEDNGRKTALFLGEGLWRWRLQEYVKEENHKAFDELVSKLVQYLSSKEDKRKFKVYPLENEYFDNEQVVFESEVYNDIFERTYGQEIDLTITDEDNQKYSYSYTTNENNTKYRIGGLKQGLYNYTASAVLNGERVESKGEFTVRQLQIESVNLLANFDLLRSVANSTNGKFYQTNQLQFLEKDLLNQEFQGIIHTSEEFLPIINMSWIFFLLLLLITGEWFLRRYNNSY